MSWSKASQGGRAITEGLGWCSVILLRGRGHIALLDPGAFGARRIVRARLAELGVALDDVTDVLVSHSHFDHCVNWPLFGNSRIVIGADEMRWSITQADKDLVPQLYVRELNELPRAHLAHDGEEVLPGITAHLTRGHTPGHLTYILHGSDRDAIFTGDAAKNRAELLSHQADLTYDAALSTQSIDVIWAWWRERPNSVLVPGHDIAMVQDHGVCRYLEPRAATITAWYGEDLKNVSVIDLVVDFR